MRFSTLGVGLLAICAASALAADKPTKLTPAEEHQAAKMAKVDAVAKQAFTAADRNHNDILSKTEFANAEELLAEGVMGLGQQGVLGQIPKGADANAAEASVKKAVSGAPTNLAKKNRISLSEFQLFARSYAAQADVQMAQNNAMQQAQMQQMQRHSRGRRQVRTGTPIFLGP